MLTWLWSSVLSPSSSAPTKPDEARAGQSRAYALSALAFLICLALLLVGIVEMRRAFLFPLADYLRIGAPTAVFYFDPRQLPLLMVGGVGAWMAYRRMAALEKTMGGPYLQRFTVLVAVAIFVLLVGDLFIYRGVAAFRIANAGGISAGQAIPLTAFPGWAQPVREGLNYLFLVWHAMLMAVLLGALFLAATTGRTKSWLSGQGFRTHLTGAMLAIPQPFCSCCSAPIGATLYRQGASLGATLAFIVSSPMLNVSGLLLAVLLLPWEFAVLRVLGGVVIGVFATYVVSLFAVDRGAGGEREQRASGSLAWVAAAVERYVLLLDLQRLVAVRPTASPASFISVWLMTAWHLGKVIIPIVLFGSVITAAIVSAIPSPQNHLMGVVAAAAFGTLVMVPTWTEIPIVSQLIQEGLTGPAATLLLTLPAVSVPCLAVITGAVKSLKTSLLLGLAVFAIGVLAGSIFLVL